MANYLRQVFKMLKFMFLKSLNEAENNKNINKKLNEAENDDDDSKTDDTEDDTATSDTDGEDNTNDDTATSEDDIESDTESDVEGDSEEDITEDDTDSDTTDDVNMDTSDTMTDTETDSTDDENDDEEEEIDLDTVKKKKIIKILDKQLNIYYDTLDFLSEINISDKKLLDFIIKTTQKSITDLEFVLSQKITSKEYTDLEKYQVMFQTKLKIIKDFIDSLIK